MTTATQDRQDRSALRDLTLLVIEREGTSGTDARGMPLHDLEVQVAQYEGANPQVRRTGAAMSSRGTYSSEDFLDVVTAAWQQDDAGDPTPIPDSSDRTEQNVLDEQGRVCGSVYVVRGDLVRGTGRLLAGSVSREDPGAVPDFVMAAQSQAVTGRGHDRQAGSGVLGRLQASEPSAPDAGEARAQGPQRD